MSPRHLRLASPAPIRLATEKDRRAAETAGRIPFERINPSALVFAEDLYESLAGEVDSVAFGAAVALYLESAS